MSSKAPIKSLIRLFTVTPTPRPISRALCTAPAAAETQTQKLERIADELLDLNKLERYDYSILFRYKMGFNNYGPSIDGIGAAGAVSDGKGSGAAEDVKSADKTAFDIKLEKYDASAKIKIIKEVRTFTDLGLKEAKELVEKAPVVIKKGLTKEEASKIVEKLKELGGTAVLE